MSLGPSGGYAMSTWSTNTIIIVNEFLESFSLRSARLCNDQVYLYHVVELEI